MKEPPIERVLFTAEQIDQRIADIKKRLGQAAPARTTNEQRPKRVLSASARHRISMAQKKRWARVRRQKRAA